MVVGSFVLELVIVVIVVFIVEVFLNYIYDLNKYY